MGSLYNGAKQKMQVFGLWPVAVSLGPEHNLAHFLTEDQGLHCCRKLLVMEGAGHHPLGDVNPHTALGNLQLGEAQIRSAMSELQGREGAGRSLETPNK